MRSLTLKAKKNIVMKKVQLPVKTNSTPCRLKNHDVSSKERGRFVYKHELEQKMIPRTRMTRIESEENAFRCGRSEYRIGRMSETHQNKNQRAFVGGSWSDKRLGRQK
ncbi:hypothetical protein Tco_0936873 [Tanacetum coccineum]|uniref:Uncharacterized protein n=1 Tax=Tanacetum coccineum TaxID=301880 RepID=A0ABQ5DEK9_9ASTR